MAVVLMISVSGCSRWVVDYPTPARSAIHTPQRNIRTRTTTTQNRAMPQFTKRVAKQSPPMPLVRGIEPQSLSPQLSSTSELASHETEFNAKEKDRNTNISRAAESINGKIIQPGEVFSFNETVGPTIERRGYKKGVIFIKGEKSEGFGGGVCQVSTTLHQAAVGAGMTILERHDHSLPVGYAKSGEEAATSYGGLDFKFKNDKTFPVLIKSNVTNGKVKVAIHSA